VLGQRLLERPGEAAVALGEQSLAAERAGQAAPADLLAALAQDLRPGPPAVIVLEDMHWADEATLDLLRVLGRRIETLPAVVIVTYRDGLDRAHPLRVVLGELSSGPRVDRLLLRPLSPAAVAALAQPYGVDPEGLHRRTGGNPFFVGEVLAARGAGRPDTVLPDTVRDAVLARAARLTGGRPGAAGHRRPAAPAR
jgi:hypothetical protein